MDVTVIICNYHRANRLPAVLACLAALATFPREETAGKISIKQSFIDWAIVLVNSILVNSNSVDQIVQQVVPFRYDQLKHWLCPARLGLVVRKQNSIPQVITQRLLTGISAIGPHKKGENIEMLSYLRKSEWPIWQNPHMEIEHVIGRDRPHYKSIPFTLRHSTVETVEKRERTLRSYLHYYSYFHYYYSTLSSRPLSSLYRFFESKIKLKIKLAVRILHNKCRIYQFRTLRINSS